MVRYVEAIILSIIVGTPIFGRFRVLKRSPVEVAVVKDAFRKRRG